MKILTVVLLLLLAVPALAQHRIVGSGSGSGLTYTTETDEGDTSVFTPIAPNTYMGFGSPLTMQGSGIFGVSSLGLRSSLFINTAGATDSSYIYWFEGGDSLGAYLLYDSIGNAFTFSNVLIADAYRGSETADSAYATKGYTESLKDADSLQSIPLQDTTGNIQDNYVYVWNESAGRMDWEAQAGAGGGETNTISAVGETAVGADSLTAGKSGLDLRVKSIIAGDSLNAVVTDTTVTLDVSGFSNYLPLAGGTMSGDIAMGDNDITGLDDISFGSGFSFLYDGAAGASRNMFYLNGDSIGVSWVGGTGEEPVWLFDGLSLIGLAGSSYTGDRLISGNVAWNGEVIASNYIDNDTSIVLAPAAGDATKTWWDNDTLYMVQDGEAEDATDTLKVWHIEGESGFAYWNSAGLPWKYTSDSSAQINFFGSNIASGAADVDFTYFHADTVKMGTSPADVLQIQISEVYINNGGDSRLTVDTILGVDSIAADAYTDGSIDAEDIGANEIDSIRMGFGVISPTHWASVNSPVDEYAVTIEIQGNDTTIEFEPQAGGGGLTYFEDSTLGDTAILAPISPDSVIGFGEHVTLRDHDLTGVKSLTVEGAESGTITLTGITSGSAAITVADAAGTPSEIVLPTADGTNGYQLTTDGSGVTSWGAAGGEPTLEVKENGATVDDSVGVLDFGAGFDLTESPTHEINIALDYTENQIDLTTDVTGLLPGSNIADQTILGDHIDSTSENFVFDEAYKGTSAVADSAYATENNVISTASTYFDSTMDHLDGMAYDKPTFSLINSSSASGIVLDIEKEGGGDMVFRMAGADYTLDCTTGAGAGGVARVVVTDGSDANTPTTNYVYVDTSGAVATLKSSTALPTGVFAWIGKVIVPDTTTFNTTGAYGFQRYTEAFVNSDRGTESHAREKLRALGAVWISGAVPTLNIDSITPDRDSVHLFTTAGSIYQLHRQSWPATDSTIDYYYGNGPDIYEQMEDLGLALKDQNGDTLGNRRYNLILWGAINYSTGDCKMFVNLPSGSYGTNATALADGDNTADYTVPDDMRSVAFLIARVVMRHQNTNLRYSELATYSLLGQPVGVRGAGAVSVGALTEFADNVFRVNDNTDATKQIAFEAGSITTGNVRTLTVPDADGTIALTADLDVKLDTTLTDTYIFVGDGTNGATGVAMSGDASIANDGTVTIDHGDLDGLTDDDHTQYLKETDTAAFALTVLENSIITTSMNIPNDPNPTTDAIGERAIDSDDGMHETYDSVYDVSLIYATNLKTFQFELPASFNDTASLIYIDSLRHPHGIKIVQIRIHPDDSVAFSTSFAETTDSTRLAWIDTVANVTASWHTTSAIFTDSDIAPGHYIEVAGPDVAETCQVTISYYIKEGN